MKTGRFVLSLCLAAWGMGAHADEPAEAGAEIAAAKAAVGEFAGALQAQLKSALQAGGPVAAIEVCHARAPAIARQVGATHGFEIGRVSLGNRNPGNSPNDWQRAVLQAFEARKQAGDEIAGLLWSETAGTAGGKEFRLMKAIPAAGICLQCHGSDIAPEVAQALARLYPEDRATGYREGDIRGAFVVTRKITD